MNRAIAPLLLTLLAASLAAASALDLPRPLRPAELPEQTLPVSDEDFAADEDFAEDEEDEDEGDEDEDEGEEDEDEGEEDEFANWDRNGDGVVTREEADLDAREFKRMDRDGDKRLTRAEVERYWLEEHVSEVFVERDRDLSGTLSREEVEQEWRERFGEIDADANGQISGKELLAFFEAERVREVEGGEGAEDAAAIVIRAAQRAPQETIGADAFPGSQKLFAAIDADGDRKVTREEAVAFRKRGVELMEQVWRLEGRAEEARVPHEAWGLLMREAEACFQGGRYAELPSLTRELGERIRRALAARQETRKSMRAPRAR